MITSLKKSKVECSQLNLVSWAPIFSALENYLYSKNLFWHIS